MPLPFTMPAEFAPQDLLWIGFPHDPAEWPRGLAAAQAQIAAFANAVAGSGQDTVLVVRDEAVAARAGALVSGKVGIEHHPMGDIWLRDTGPVTVLGPHGQRRAQGFGFNGWGGKFIMAGDELTGASLASAAGLDYARADWVLEGGALDTDGTGLLVTTQQCLLNANRNPHLTRTEIEARLARDLGLTRVLWLGDGLMGDHTDGHVDNLARFVAPGVLALPQSAPDAGGPGDPNAAIYADAKARAEAAGLQVRLIPSPGRMGAGDDVEPASYMNFAITSHLVVVPTYGSPHDSAAVTAIAALFPGRETIGLPADAVLAGGGSFHCCSCHVPTGARAAA